MVVYPIIIILFAVFIFIYYYLTKNNDYWKKRNVAHLKPSLLFGNYKEYILFKKCRQKVAHEICQKFPDEPYVGTFYGTDPALIIKDPGLIKLVMAKDFYYFNHREVSQHTHKELLTQNMFFNGGDTWRIFRQNLTSLFSSAKIKNMFYLIESCARSLEDIINKEKTKDNIIEMKSVLSRYTMDCIGNCAFGVSTGTLETNSPSNIFSVMGIKLFDVSNYGGFKLYARSMWPDIFYKLGLTLFESDIHSFFTKLMTEVFESRQYNQSSRNDFVDLVLSWKKKNYITGDTIMSLKTGEKTAITLNVDNDLLISQCVLFFAAGYETTATTTSFLLYELSKNKKAQARVIEEIDDYLKRHDGKIEYECINEMPFVQACIDETLRLYPVLGLLTREVIEEYTLPTGLRLEKNSRVHIPVHHLHHNPEHFPDPEEFRPERFFGDERKNIKQYTFMPFGEGPRICLGLRFSKMPMYASLLTIFKNYSVELAEGMPLTIDLQPRALVVQAMCDVNIKLIPRRK